MLRHQLECCLCVCCGAQADRQRTNRQRGEWFLGVTLCTSLHLACGGAQKLSLTRRAAVTRARARSTCAAVSLTSELCLFRGPLIGTSPSLYFPSPVPLLSSPFHSSFPSLPASPFSGTRPPVLSMSCRTWASLGFGKPTSSGAEKSKV